MRINIPTSWYVVKPAIAVALRGTFANFRKRLDLPATSLKEGIGTKGAHRCCSGGNMVAVVSTTAYLGIDARGVEVQCQITPGVPRFVVVGLPDKAVGESRERVRAAMAAIGLSLPPKVITVNLSPADLPKEGSHYDLPIALALLGAMGVIDAETLASYVVVGELGLDGRIASSPGVLLAAIHAGSAGLGLICPAAQGPEAAWAGNVEVLGAPDLLSLLNHFKGNTLLAPPVPGEVER